MKTLAVLFAGELNAYSLESLSGGASAFERAVSCMCRVPGVRNLLILSSDNHLDGYPSPSRGALAELASAAASSAADAISSAVIIPEFAEGPSWTVEGLFARLAVESEPFDRVVFAFADQPHMDAEFSARLSEQHEGYAAEYTFADGYPSGLAPEFLARGIVPVLARLSEG